ncbi:MAG: ChaN family lipoprotein, partial [Gemmatimonadaceae bacterium]|nr:ChaN family lipoprotein [Gemmatimonadaceae bacterium]
MRTPVVSRIARPLGLVLVIAGCRGVPAATAPELATLTVLSADDGRAVPWRTLAAQLRSADVVLLGELHDNPEHHRVRAALFAAVGDRARPVFEHFAQRDGALPTPAAGESREAWLDRAGFDRAGWGWPLHAPLVDAALAAGRPMRGTNLSREVLRDVVRRGPEAAAPSLATLVG